MNNLVFLARFQLHAVEKAWDHINPGEKTK